MTAAAGTAARRRQGHLGGHQKAKVVGIDTDAFHLLQKFIVDAEGKTALFDPGIVLTGFVQRQGKARAGAAAGGKVDADGRFFPVGKKTFQFLPGGIGQREHGTTSSVARNM